SSMADVWTGGDEIGEQPILRGVKVENEENGEEVERMEGGGGVDGTDGAEAMEEGAPAGDETVDNPPSEDEEGEDNPFADDDDDEDDAVQVTIGEIRPNVQFATKPDTRAAPIGGKGAIDLDTVPVIDGVVLYDMDLAQSEDKPWRKPGADPSDYFNYGFTEETWNLYCERQKKLRVEFSGNQQMVNRHIMAGITLANPLGNAPVSNMSGNNRILVDNTRRHYHHRNNDENAGGGGHTITRLGSTTSNIPTLGSVPDFSRPPPIMTIPTMGGAKADHSGTSVGSGEPAPPGSEDVDVSTPTSIIPPVNISMPPPGAAPIQSISTLGGMDMSLPPPGFNPSMPPPHLMGPPGGVMPNTNMPPPGFNPMMPPPPHFGGQGGHGGPPMFGRAGYAGGMHGGMGRGMGRPPPLMRGDHYGDMQHRRDSSEFDRDRERREREREKESSGDDTEERRHRRSERKKSRSPSKGGSRRREDRSERRERGEERERSSRRHRSSSRDRRESRKKDESKRSRGGGGDEERSEKKKRRHDKEEEREHSSSGRSKRSRRDDGETITVKQEPIDNEGTDE
ncbi:hypothetical protein PENTCL1PPCAC_11292, partial [Pristionchus entomophagus]